MVDAPIDSSVLDMSAPDAQLRDVGSLPPDRRPHPRQHRLALFETRFEFVDRRAAALVPELDTDGLRDLSLATYRKARRSEDGKLAGLGSLRVTIAHDVRLFRARRG